MRIGRFHLGHVGFLLVRAVVLMALAAAVVWAVRTWVPGMHPLVSEHYAGRSGSTLTNGSTP